MTLDTHIYFVPALHLHQSLIKSGSWVRMGECIVLVRPCADKDLYAVILACPEVTPCFERRQALRAVANKDVPPSIHPRDPVTRLIHDIELPLEGPVPLLSLLQLTRQNTTNWFELYQGSAKRIKCRSLIHDLNVVSVRGDDNEDLMAEHLPFAPGSRQNNERTQCFAQFGAFAARDSWESESSKVRSLHWSSWSGGEQGESEHLTFSSLLFHALIKGNVNYIYITKILLIK